MAVPPLSETDEARISETRRLVYECVPEFLPFIKAMHELGLLDGWRSVSCRRLTPDPNNTPVDRVEESAGTDTMAVR